MTEQTKDSAERKSHMARWRQQIEVISRKTGATAKARWAAFRKERDDLEAALVLGFYVIASTVALILFLIVLPWEMPIVGKLVPEITPCDGAVSGAPCYGWDDFRSLMFGLAGLVGAVFGLYQLANSATRTRLARIDTTVKREAERNERFVRAAELLAHEDGAVRMAGIYALERLAQEAEGKYLKTVIEVLAGFIRERTNRDDYAPRAAAGAKPIRGKKEDGTQFKEDEDAFADRVNDWYENWLPPTEPITTAFHALQRLSGPKVSKGEKDFAANLAGSKIPKIKFEPGNISFWNFEYSCIYHSFSPREGLVGDNVNFSSSNLVYAALASSEFLNCRLVRADVRGASLASANLTRANLTRANFRHANLSDASLKHAKIGYADVREAYLDSADLSGADLSYADLSMAQLLMADLRRACLHRTKLARGRLIGAKLRQADLWGADFSGADLRWADLTEVLDLTHVQLHQAVWTHEAPELSAPFDPDQFDKSWCTDPDTSQIRDPLPDPPPFDGPTDA